MYFIIELELYHIACIVAIGIDSVHTVSFIIHNEVIDSGDGEWGEGAGELRGPGGEGREE